MGAHTSKNRIFNKFMEYKQCLLNSTFCQFPSKNRNPNQIKYCLHSNQCLYNVCNADIQEDMNRRIRHLCCVDYSDFPCNTAS